MYKRLDDSTVDRYDHSNLQTQDTSRTCAHTHASVADVI